MVKYCEENYIALKCVTQSVPMGLNDRSCLMNGGDMTGRIQKIKIKNQEDERIRNGEG